MKVELSFDIVIAETTRPEHAHPDGTPRRVKFYVLENELDHLQLESTNQSEYRAGQAESGNFKTNAAQDKWLKDTGKNVTMDLDPRLHELEDLENASFRATGSYKAFETVSADVLDTLFPKGLGRGVQPHRA